MFGVGGSSNISSTVSAALRFIVPLVVVVILQALGKAAIFTDDLRYNWDAGVSSGNLGNSGALEWQSTSPASNTDATWSFGSDVTLENVTSDFDIDQAYEFVNANAGDLSDADGTGDSLQDLAETASFEFWIKPASFGDVDTKQVIFETGGFRFGLSLTLWHDTVKLATSDYKYLSSPPTVVLEHQLNSSDLDDFIHLVGVIDGDNDKTTLYVNGTEKDAVKGAEWGNTYTRSAGLGGANLLGAGANSGDWDYTTFDPFDGQIAILRGYNRALNVSQVEQNFDTLRTDRKEPEAVVPEPTTFVVWSLLGLVGVGFYQRVRRNRRNR